MNGAEVGVNRTSRTSILGWDFDSRLRNRLRRKTERLPENSFSRGFLKKSLINRENKNEDIIHLFCLKLTGF